MGQSGGKIELMGTVNGVLNLFCAAIMLLLWGGLLQQQLHKPPREVKYFRYMLFAAFIMMLLESIAWLVLLPYDGWFRFVSTLSSIVFFVFLGLYTRYIYYLLRLRSGLIYRLVQMNDLLCGAATVLVIVNWIHPFIYDYRTLHFLHPAGAALPGRAEEKRHPLYLLCGGDAAARGRAGHAQGGEGCRALCAAGL